ncbi:hypothetical protein KUH32_11270 [Thalassococcus sp. CAU 1522]|uniref:Uncharacterized protein n=1 Tax=Thalassococcus arenae TaxID=2851652 RepID=A0ABS6N8M9_9RHOB|nr:hypothetical protein [Thalassococcus arenae]MBV2360359.1 hypothetical protein [Thalassococcus arenae]
MANTGLQTAWLPPQWKARQQGAPDPDSQTAPPSIMQIRITEMLAEQLAAPAPAQLQDRPAPDPLPRPPQTLPAYAELSKLDREAVRDTAQPPSFDEHRAERDGPVA